MFTSLKYVMATVAFLLSANVMADDISWTGQSDWTGIGEAEIELATDVYSVFCVKNNGSTNPTVNSGANDLRVYAKGTLRILTEKTMTAIVFNISAQGKKRLTDITASTGTVTIDKSAWTVTWTGSATDVTFTVGEKATYGTDGDTKAGQFDIDSPIKVTTSDDGVFVPAPVITPASGTYTEAQTVTITAQDGLEIWVSKQIGDVFAKYTAPFEVSEDATITAYAVDKQGNQSTTVTVAYTFVSAGDLTGDGTANNPYTVADVLALYATNTYTSDKVYVKGKISEIKSIDVSKYDRAQYFISDDGTTANQFLIYNGYYLNGEKFTANDQIKVGDEVVVYGQLTIFGTTQEMAANNYIFSLNGQGGTVVEPDKYESIAAACAAVSDTHKDAYITLKDVVVTYLNGNSVYVLEQASGRGFLFYGTNGLPADLKVGDVLQGTVFGDFYAYHGLPEMTPAANGTELTVSGNTTVEPNAVELSDMLADPAAYASMLISLEGFMFNETGLTDKAVTISQYGDEATLFDQFQVLTGVTFDTDAEYTATFITSVRDGVLQLYPVNKDEFGGGEVETPFYETIGAIKAAATADKVESIFKMNDMLVSYANGKSVYVTDGRLGFLLFASAATSYKAGDKLSGDVKGNLYVRYGVPQLEYTVPDNNITVTSSGNEVTYPAVDIDMVNNNYNELLSMAVELSRVTITAEQLESKNVTIKQGDKEVVLRDNFGILSDLTFDTEAEYNIKVIVAVYVKDDATTIQVYPINRSDFVNEEYVFDGDGTLETPYSVADVIYMHLNSQDPADKVWVKGTIIGCVNGSFKAEKFANTQGDENLIASNIVLAPSTSSAAGPRKAPAFDASKCIPVELKNNTVFREILNLVDNFGNLGKEVLINGNVTAYFSAPGVKNLEDAIIDGVSLGVHGVELDKAPLSGDIYTLAGQRVSTMTRGGLYIIGGKKVLVK